MSVYLDMKPGIIQLPADAKLPVRVEKTIVSEKRMLIVFWGIHGVAHYYWLPKDGTLDSPLFCEEGLSPLYRLFAPLKACAESIEPCNTSARSQ
jgi:hypothetical protein